MNESRALIVETAERIFRDLCTKECIDEAERGVWAGALWEALEASGLSLAAVPEHLGGSGGSIGDAMAVLRLAGRYAAPLPLAETFLAGHVLSAADLPVPAGPLTIAIPSESETLGLQKQDGVQRISGAISRVPWASTANTIIALATMSTTSCAVALDPKKCTLAPSKNLAGEPRDSLTLDDVSIDASEVVAPAIDRIAARRLGALCRAVQMAGALERVLAMTIEHANVRVQFGRPIASFQAIRQQIAVMAGQVAAASKAAETAVMAAESGDAKIEIAVAKARVGEAAGIVCEIAHQVHGAMGITHEHALHQFTRRAWSWRDEFGNETEWQTVLGRHIAQAGADVLWPFISGVS